MQSPLFFILLAGILCAFAPAEAKAADKDALEGKWEKALTLTRPKWVISGERARQIAAVVESETHVLQREKMEAALRVYHQFLRDAALYEEEQHYRLLFTDEEYRLQQSQESPEWQKMDLHTPPDRNAMILANRAFLEWQVDNLVDTENADQWREAYALAAFGKKMNEEEFFHRVASDFDALMDISPIVDAQEKITGFKNHEPERWWKTPAATAAQGKRINTEIHQVIAYNLQTEQEGHSIVSLPAPSREQLLQWEEKLRLPRPKGLISDAEGRKLLLQYDPEQEDAPTRLVLWKRYKDAVVLYQEEQHYRLLYSDPAYREHILKTNGSWSLIVHHPSPQAALHTAMNSDLLAWLSGNNPSKITNAAMASYGKEILGMNRINSDALYEKIASNFDHAVRWQLKFDATGNIIAKEDLNPFRAWDEKKLMEAVADEVNNSNTP